MDRHDEDFLHALAEHDWDDMDWSGQSELRNRVYNRTRGRLRLRRVRRYAIAAVLVMGVYAAGLATPYPVHVNEAPVASAPVERVAAPNQQQPMLDVERLALQLATSTPDQQARLLQRAGDTALERGDLSAALEYYRLYLDKVPRAARSRVEATDSWLLIVLRPDETKETDHVVQATY